MAEEKQEPTKEVAQITKSESQRFSEAVVKQFTNGVAPIVLTDFQQRLVQNYFVSIDYVLKTNEEKRVASSNAVAFVWSNVNMEDLSRKVVSLARNGLDPAQKNHINFIPYLNKKTNKYDIGFIEGYKGLELIANKYGLDVPDYFVTELVYKKDFFKPIKKDFRNRVETYEFTVSDDAFDRGEVIGGFYYHGYTNKPEKNKLVVMSIKEIEKRKPKYASAEFWGGEKDIWENGKKTGKKETIEGWHEQMCLKTIERACYNAITIDSQKIDDDYRKLKENENILNSDQIKQEIKDNGNKQKIDFEDAEIVEPKAIEQKTEIQDNQNFDNEKTEKVEQGKLL